MRSFRNYIKEQVLPSVQVADGGLDIEKPAVRAAINAAIAGVVSQPAVTPYVVYNRLSKLLAQYHIILPRKFLEGDKGVEVFEIRQFGHKMGMTDGGEFVKEVPSTHYLFLQYGIITPFGITYAKPVVGGMFRVMARLVDKEELDKLMDMAEITMAEEAEHMQAIYKANAPRDPMHDITSDEKKKGNKAAVADSQKGLDEEYEKIEAGVKKRRGETHTLHRRNPGHKTEYHTITTERDGRKTVKTGSPKYIRKHWDKLEEAFGVYRKGGSIGEKPSTDPIKSFDNEADAKSHAKGMNRQLSPGEKKYYGIKYHVKPIREEEQLDELTGKGKLPALKAVYKGDKDYHTRGADYHAARAERAERRGEESKAERHMDAGYGHEHKAERAEAKSKRASALMTRAKAHADIKASKAASKSARAEYNEETQIDELKKSTLASYIKKAHVSGLEAASQGEIAYVNKDKAGLRAANKTGEKREQGIERAASKLAKEETLKEKLTKRMSAGDVISDFVHSKDPKFKGKSTKERQKMALGAYYGMHPEKSRKE